MGTFKHLLIGLLVVVAIGSIWYVQNNKNNVPLNQSNSTTTPKENTQLANPASTNCIKQGGRLDIREDKEGGQYGVCVFNNGSECEEWAFFRGECQKGVGEDDFCGYAQGTCKTNSDCIVGGCSSQVCQSKSQDPVVTTCEFRECYKAEKYNLSCQCVENNCQWK